MYRTIQSPASVAAGPLVARPGLASAAALEPVLCCPAVVTAVVGLVQSAVTSAVVNAAENDPGCDGECTDAATAICTSSLYVSPGRLSAGGPRVSDNASVDDLISAIRRDMVSA
jgi:hypothetical protein